MYAIIVKTIGFILVNLAWVSMAFAQAETTLAVDTDDHIIQPNVIQLETSQTLLDRSYRRINGAIQILNAPNGSPISSLDQGFNFFTILRAEGDWVEVNPNQWVRSDELSPANVSSFAGVLLNEHLEFPMAWVLINLHPSAEPGSEADLTTPLLERYDRVNIYDSVDVDGSLWYQIGSNQWINQVAVGKIETIGRPAQVNTYRWVAVDLYEQVAVAYEGTTPVFGTLVSSGLADWPTREGVFHVYARYDRTNMSGAEGQPDFYRLEEVPYTMYFDGDIALHGTYWHDGFGYRRSHGCVNLSITDANWIFNWAAQEFDVSTDSEIGVAVYVYSSGQY